MPFNNKSGKQARRRSVALTLPKLPKKEKRPSYPPKVGLGRVSKREGDDRYCGVIFEIPETQWRVAVCKDGYQWLLQQREGDVYR